MNYVVETSKNENGTVIAEGIKCFFLSFLREKLNFSGPGEKKKKKTVFVAYEKVKLLKRLKRPDPFLAVIHSLK